MLSQNPMVPPERPLSPQLPSDLPDTLDTDTVLTVVDVRTVMVVGFAAGALVPCIPLVILGSVGIVATILFNRGTIGFTAFSTSASGITPMAVVTLLFVVLSSGALGALMGAVRRWSVRREIILEFAGRLLFLVASGPAFGHSSCCRTPFGCSYPARSERRCRVQSKLCPHILPDISARLDSVRVDV